MFHLRMSISEDMERTDKSDRNVELVVAIGNKLPPHKQRSWIYQSGKCLFKLRRCQAHLERINSVYSEIEQLEPASFLTKIGIVKFKPIEELFYSYYEGPLAPELFFNVDGFFESAKSCVDFSLNMLGSAGVLKNPPNSMNSTIKDLHRHRRQSGDVIADALKAFWDDGGKLTKEYRDCFTHFVALAGDHWQTAINIKCEGNVTKARYFLPDNPSAKKNSAFTYDRHVDSRELAEKLMKLLSIYISAALKQCAYKVQLEKTFSVNIPKEYHNIMVGTW
jgi:hypothetical protein